MDHSEWSCKIIAKKKKNKLRELKHGHKQQIEIPQPIIEEEKKSQFT